MSKKPSVQTPEPQWEVLAKGHRSARLVSTAPLPEGTYTLLADRWTDENDEEHVRGDTLDLDAATATRLGAAGTIAPPGSDWAEEARRTPGARSADARTAPRF